MVGSLLWWEVCYGGKYAMVGSMLWWEVCYGEKYAMVGSMLWWEVCYGRKYAMVGSMLWWEVSYGGKYAMVGSMLWWGVCYGGKYAMVGSMLWWKVCYGEKYAMVRSMLWWEVCYGGKYAMVRSKLWWEVCCGGKYAMVGSMLRWGVCYGGKSVMVGSMLWWESTSVTVSVLTLSAISVERWWAICYPLRFKSTLPRARKIIVAIWIVSCLSAIPELVSADTSPYSFPERIKTVLLTKCGPTWDDLNQGIYQVIVTVLFYLIPMILMALTYSHIATVLWRHEIPGDVVGTKTSD
ncbi:Orexin receptor type 2 [Bulinus truncatus]|nr:Orexin receptor type 2 [Bulinus truncatus]